jgi:hypothetical protein
MTALTVSLLIDYNYIPHVEDDDSDDNWTTWDDYQTEFDW